VLLQDARSTRLRGRAVGRRISCLDESFLDVLLDAGLDCLQAGNVAIFVQVTAGQPALPLAGWQG